MKKALILLSSIFLLANVYPVVAQEDNTVRIDEINTRVEELKEEIAPLQQELDSLLNELKTLSDDDYTWIEYDEIARDKNGMIGEKIQIKGRVIQVMNGDGYVQLRVATSISEYSDGYGSDDVFLVEISDDMIDSRILDDDIIHVKGMSYGLMEYETVLGAKMTIPAMIAEEVEVVE